MGLAGLVLIALALSLDAFVTGVAYGARKVWLSLPAAALIGGVSGALVYLVMGLGSWAATRLAPQVAQGIGAFLLLGAGLYYTAQPLLARLPGRRSPWSDPAFADWDRSGTLEAPEAFVLALALAADATAAALAGSLAGWDRGVFPLLVGLVQAAVVLAGHRLSHLVARDYLDGSMDIVPGLVLLMVALLRLGGVN